MIPERLKAVIFRELQIDRIPINESTTADQIAGWDSLNHARIINAIEAEYGIHFKTLEVIRLKTIGDLSTLIERKLAGL